MTPTQHNEQDITAQNMNIIHHLFEIAAPREVVFSALTTAAGLSAWWTTGVKADEAAVGANIYFTFRGPFNPHMRITELKAPAHVAWEGVSGHAAWGESTTIRFELETTSGGTKVRFWHQMGRELSADTVAGANFSWGYYLDSLRLLCETGSGKPFQVGSATARVGANNHTDSYTKTLLIHASAHQLYQAITTLPGLRSWWTDNTILNNGDITFSFSEGVFVTTKVLNSIPDKQVTWECTEQYFPVEGTTQTDEWVGTRMSFDIQANSDDLSTLVFTHSGLTPQLACYGQCNKGWNHALESLRLYLEQGTGTPFLGILRHAERVTTP